MSKTRTIDFEEVASILISKSKHYSDTKDVSEETWNALASWIIYLDSGHARAIAERRINSTPTLSTNAKCICRGCPNKVTVTPNSPYMNDYCDPCTYERHDLPTENGDPHYKKDIPVDCSGCADFYERRNQDPCTCIARCSNPNCGRAQ